LLEFAMPLLDSGCDIFAILFQGVDFNFRVL